MKNFNNIDERVVDDLKKELKAQSKLKIAAASFSIYAYEELKKELEKVDQIQFLFTSDLFTKEKAPKEKREFFIPRLNRESQLYGNEFELRMRNELSQKAIAKEAAEWIRQKVTFKSNISGQRSDNFMVVENKGNINVYAPFDEFTTAEIGTTKGEKLFYNISKFENENTQQFLNAFEQVWHNQDYVDEVTNTVLDNITAAYQENAPEFIYYIALYNLFGEFLSDLDQDYIPDERTGFKDSKIWSLLYDFQKDAVLGSISKLEKYNGVILADSVGLGKTFSAIGVIKYYESRNKNVLVLVPKRLKDNWNNYKNNYKNNPLAEDRLRYDVLFHTDMDRERGESNGIDLGKINWGNYDLVVIDESHNFRNGEGTTHKKEEGVENRYQKLMRKIIKLGVKTKVLMLSATPVNTDFSDLRNQLMLASEGDSSNLTKTLTTKKTVTEIFGQAQRAFKDWSSLETENRTTEYLLDMLDFDFFELLDSVTISRSRKHIEKYYDQSDIGKFPKRFAPINESPKLTDLDITYNDLFQFIDLLNLEVYTPLKYVYPSKIEKYTEQATAGASSWANREKGRNQLMITNLLKRAESSIHAFKLTSERILENISLKLQVIEEYKQSKNGIVKSDSDDFEDDVFTVGQDLKIDIADMDYQSWEKQLVADKYVFTELLDVVNRIIPEHDTKMATLQEIILKKIENPINKGNKKVIIFTAFSDTADYLYKYLSNQLIQKDGVHTALISGTRTESTIPGRKNDFNELLTLFSPKSKNRDALGLDGEIDVVIATDVISEGQNLQDADYLINYDIHWNPVRIIQRFGRIDRIGSTNDNIQMVNFWPDISLDEYINLKARVENRAKLVAISSTGEDTIDNTDPDMEYRKKQLETLQNEVVDLEDMSSGVNIMDLGLNEFQLDLQKLREKYGDYEAKPYGIHAITKADSNHPAGVIFVLRNRNNAMNIDKQNRLHPFYLVYIAENGKIISNHFNPKKILDDMRYLSSEKSVPIENLVQSFNIETLEGKDMSKYSNLLNQAIDSMISVKEEKDIDSLFTTGGTTALENDINGLNDFELIDFLVVRGE
ncbi:helicase-related protein [Listeria monocytogenes]|uniref:ATP-dependent helicase n=6 Tax=Listeria TaxID=1637 RepID=A0A3A7P437_LISMN|nr:MULTISPECIES: helicase-related protein [Listeria]EAG6272441.1 ATP-dependent helicase [Listeria monocytogenes CFSAN003726]EAG6284974.1 ATP-dependent helicase [Listeria monocytogenes CFSAN003810]EAG6360563.1 ATP-dependent helicase [Listeria monocytogenes CFSAN003729]EAG6369513.1 ATP-dependent helicase [Listeria monocytogenes CFSAN003728]ECR3487015.1 ATP-dependent helicase [Listeria innocua]MCX62576.1 ATP-dependent helicase [Listeria monocytogenes serotype 4b]MCX98360.1 ATP-dependent helicas